MCVQAARKNGLDGRRGAAIAGDSEHLPFTDASFDVVTCANSFHHYPRQQTVVHEMRRVLRPGGVLVLVDGFRDNVIGWAVFDVVVPAIERDVHHAAWYEIDEFFLAAGFASIRRRRSNLLLPICTTVGHA
jgi:ubiquinone/menaquinone biosynthesis C-methylase UbiE